MPKFTPPIRRKETARGHHYVDAENRRVPGVTTILGALPKDALINWAANTTADAAVNRWDELGALVEVPCRPVVIAGRAECRWEVDARRLSGARVVYLDPAPGPSAAMVREQITDARRGTP